MHDAIDSRWPFVLVADDDSDILELVAKYLERQGCRVLCAHDGAEATFILTHGKPDVAVIDIGMPKLDGIEVVRRLRAKDRGFVEQRVETRILFMTARAADADAQLAFEAGADMYLTKPFQLAELGRRVFSLARVRQA